MLLLRRWLLRTVGLWLARRGYRWWQDRRARQGMSPTGDAQVSPARRRGRRGA